MNRENHKIKVAKDFTAYPFGRYRSEGEYSGESFREDILLPAIKAGKVEVDLDDVLGGLGSSFLEEVFGGLVRSGYTPDQLRLVLNIISNEDQTLVMKSWEYVDRAFKSRK